MAKQVIFTKRSPDPKVWKANLSQGVRAGDFVFVSGTPGADPKTGKLVKGKTEKQTLRLQTKQACENIAAILKAADATLDDVVWSNVIMNKATYWPDMNEVYGTYFKKDPPVRTAYGGKMAVKDMLLEIQCIAYSPLKK